MATPDYCKVWLRACNNLPQPPKTRCREGVAEDCCLLSTIPCSGFLYLQFLARCHPYRFLHLFHSFFPNREHLHNIEGCLVFLPRMGIIPGYNTWISTRISLARTLYIRSCASSISQYTHARIELVTRKWRRILRELPNLTKSPSERYKLSVCIKKDRVRPVSKRLCIIFMACSYPNFVLGR